MSHHIQRIAFSMVLGAVFCAIFAVGANLLSGAQLIGVHMLSGIIVGGIFGVLGAAIVTLGSIVVGSGSKLLHIGGGLLFGAVMYLANVYFGFNAGFTIFGLALISIFGALSGVASLFVQRTFEGLSRLNQLS